MKVVDPLVWPAGKTVRLTRHFEDSAATLFRAFTDADALRQWWGPRDFRIEHIDFRAVEGGEYLVRLRAPDGSRWAHGGRFLIVDPPTRLVYTWQWTEGPMPRMETLVELTFTDEMDGSGLTVAHGPFEGQEACDGHAVGWTDTFERLEVWLERT